MNPELVNIYIERLIKEIEELTKSRLLADTQINYLKTANDSLIQNIEDLKGQIEVLQDKINKQEKVR
jgi:cell division protein FtsB